jgi:hypothetical protein
MPRLSNGQSLVSPARGSPLFQKGVSDRQAWERWFASLNGDYRAGAAYWAGQRSLPDPGVCQGVVASKDDGQFTAGCLSAKERLVYPDTLRKDVDYQAGWDSP